MNTIKRTSFYFSVLFFALVVFADISLAVAQAAATPPQPGFGEVMARMFPMFVIVFLIYYLMIAKPQQQKLKSQQDLMAELKKGDSVVTTGGLFGKVVSLDEGVAQIELAPNVKVRIEVTHIARKLDANAASSSN